MSRVVKKSGNQYQASYPDYGDKKENNTIKLEEFTKNLSIKDRLEKLLKEIKKTIKNSPAC